MQCSNLFVDILCTIFFFFRHFSECITQKINFTNKMMVGSIAFQCNTGLLPPTGLEYEALDGTEESIGNGHDFNALKIFV